MAVEFSNKQFLADEMPKDGVLVIDVNLQNITCLEVVQSRFVEKFPETYKKYRDIVVRGRIVAGEVRSYEENGYKIAVAFTTFNRIGERKSSDQAVEQATEKAIEKLVLKYGKDAKYYSGVLNRHTQTFYPLVGGLQQYNWLVYRN